MFVNAINFAPFVGVGAQNSKPKIHFKGNASTDSFEFSKSDIPKRKEILDTVDKSKPFSEAGLKGVVYKYKKGDKNYAVKMSKIKDFKFEREAEVLKKVPSNINSQQYVDYFQHPKTGCDVLVSTFVEGKKGILKNSDDFDKFFDKILELDKAEVLHGDLNMQNCLFDKNNDVRLIDFGEGETFKTGDTYEDFIYPDFVLKSNVVNLEHNGIPDCIKSWEKEGADVKKSFSEYLTSKGKYYKNHAGFLKDNAPHLKEAIKYEENYAQVLENPSDEVIENEIRRIDCLHTFEDADTAVNYKNIPSAAKRNWTMAKDKAKSEVQFIDETLKKPDISSCEKEYFENQKEIANMFQTQFSSWGSSTIKWLNGLHNKKDPSDLEKRLLNNEDKTMPPPVNLVKIVMK